MRSALLTWRGFRKFLFGGLALPASLLVTGGSGAADVPPPLPPLPGAVAAPQVVALSLVDCRSIALEKQPALAAARASLDAAKARWRGLERPQLASLLAPDLSIRRQQASLSVLIAEAAVLQTEWETTYAVTRTYYTAVYARQQRAVLEERLKDLKLMHDATQTRLKDEKEKAVTKRDLERIAVYEPLVLARREEAIQGEKRALAALREAMGVGPDCCLQLADATLPGSNTPVCRDDVIRLALERRGEMAQASVAAEITAYEIKAQKLSLLPSARTFASAGDIHARPVPQGMANHEYRPGALSLEMPPSLAGPKASRVEQARALHARAQAVVDKTRDLIALEADNAYLRWLEASNQLAQFEQAADRAAKLAKGLRERFEELNSPVTAEQVLNAGVLATEFQTRANEARYLHLLALAALERIAAGGFCASYNSQAAAR
jgi:outer membrane protein TolC